jgi:hypothetical protein
LQPYFLARGWVYEPGLTLFSASDIGRKEHEACHTGAAALLPAAWLTRETDRAHANEGHCVGMRLQFLACNEANAYARPITPVAARRQQ